MGIGILLLLTSTLSVCISNILMKIIDDILPTHRLKKLYIAIIIYIMYNSSCFFIYMLLCKFCICNENGTKIEEGDSRQNFM